MNVIEDLMFPKYRIIGDIIDNSLKYNCEDYEGNMLLDTWFDIYQINPDYSIIYGIYANNIVNFGLIYPPKKLIIPAIYPKIIYSNESTCIITINQNNHQLEGFIDSKNGYSLTPFSYAKCFSFHNHYALVKLPNNKLGVIKRDKIIYNMESPYNYAIAPKYTNLISLEQEISHKR